MADRVVITTGDLEHAVRINAQLESAGFETALATSVDEARQAILRREPIPDWWVLTGGLHEPSAAQLLGLARDRSISTLGLVESTEPDPKGLARGLGLTAFLEKPADAAEVVATVRRLIERRRLQQRTGIIGESPPIQEVLVKIEQMAPVPSTVLIEGESGTGKELVARGIHDLSPRRGKPFVAVNCAALPETLLESELFGHEKGAFTGAAERRLGRFELADGGTIFLDEVGEMTPATQVKLLRVLEDRTFFRVGGTQPIKVDVRVIGATNRTRSASGGAACRCASRRRRARSRDRSWSSSSAASSSSSSRSKSCDGASRSGRNASRSSRSALARRWRPWTPSHSPRGTSSTVPA